MAFEIGREEPVAEAVRRIVGERLAEAAKALAGKRVKDSGVHTARKRIKEARAALRLVREALGKQTFANENRALRDAARPLSDVRDAAVMIETLDALVDHFAKEVRPTAFDALRKALVARHRAARHQVADDGAVARSAKEVARYAARAKGLPIGASGWEAIEPGLRRAYRDGANAMEAAVDGDAEKLHEWRKRVKDLRYQLEMQRQAWEETLEALASQAHELSNLLGTDHDLAVLTELADGELRNLMPKQGRQALAALVGKRRRALQSQAMRIGRKLYAERPKDFVARVSTYWHTWRSAPKPAKRLASGAP